MEIVNIHDGVVCFKQMFHELISLIHVASSSAKDVDTILTHYISSFIDQLNLEPDEFETDIFTRDYLQDWHTLAIAFRRPDLCVALKWSRSFNLLKELRYALKNDDLNSLRYLLSLKLYHNNQHKFAFFNKLIVDNVKQQNNIIVCGLLEDNNLLYRFLLEFVSTDLNEDDFIRFLGSDAFSIYYTNSSKNPFLTGFQSAIAHYQFFLDALIQTY